MESLRVIEVEDGFIIVPESQCEAGKLILSLSQFAKVRLPPAIHPKYKDEVELRRARANLLAAAPELAALVIEMPCSCERPGSLSPCKRCVALQKAGI